MIDYSGPIFDEIRNLLDKFTELDPHGLWDDDEWETYAREHASNDLKQYMEEKGEYWFVCEKGELDD